MEFDVIFMAGAQGAGKGTQGKRLAKKLDFFSWDTGVELRTIAAQDTPLGREVASIINGGSFVSDEILNKIMAERLPLIPDGKGMIFDGVPRRMGQAEFLLGFLKSKPRKGMVTLFIDLPREESMKRLLLRATIEKRVDDTPEAINKRLQFFDEVITPVMEVLKKETKYIVIDGRPSMDEVEKSIDAALGI